MPPSRTCAKCGGALNAESALNVCLQCVAAQILSPAGPQEIDGGAPTPVIEQPGDRIGRYKLREKLGEGGCGVVYVAEQEEPVRRRVALKVIKLGMDTRDVIARFEAERQALAMMDHANIARVFDAGATDTGRPFFVMELVRGIRITDYCDENKLDTQRRLNLFIQVCHAVQHAHQKGIIHRDLKPSNILVTINDGVPVPKVIDFGIAKATQGRLTDKTVYTQFHQFIGTPAYMSPEQAMMTSLDIDTRSDIYSLGVLLYELLTGRPPFDPRAMLAAGIDEVRRTIRDQDPPRPSTRLSALPQDDLTTEARRRSTEAQRLIHSISGDLDWIVMKCLEKDRSRRYETANGLARDLQCHLSNEPVVARPPSTAYRLKKMVRRNRLAFAAGAAVAAALVIGLTVSLWQSVEKSRALRRARAAEQEQSRLRHQAETGEMTTRIEAAKSEQVARFLTDMLEGVGPRAALGRDTTLLREILEKTAKRIGGDFGDQPEVEVKLRNIIGSVYEQLEEYPAAEAMATNALALRFKLRGGEHPEVARSLNLMGNLLYRRAEYLNAEAMHLETLAMRRRLLGNEHKDVVSSLNNLGNTILARGDLAGAEARYREAFATARKLPGEWGMAMSLYNLAVTRYLQGDNAGAEKLHRENLDIQRRGLGNDHPDLAGSLDGLAVVLAELAKLDEAEGLHREALELYRRFWGEEHPAQLNTLRNLGCTLHKRGDFAGAESAFRQVLAIQRKRRGTDDAGLAQALSDLFSLLFSSGRQAEGEPYVRECLTIWQRLHGPEAEKGADVMNKLGNALAAQGKLDEVEKMFRDALAIQRKVYGAEHPNVALTLLNLSAALGRGGDPVKSEQYARESLVIWKKQHGPEHKGVADAMNNIATALWRQKRLAEAEAIYRETLAVLDRIAAKPDDRQMPKNNLIAVLLAQGRSGEAEELIEVTLKTATDARTRSGLFERRGDLRAGKGQWSAAAGDLAQAVELDPDNHVLCHKLAPLLVQRGDLEGYRRHSQKEVAQFRQTKDPIVAERMAKDCLILPGSGVDLNVINAWADLAVAAGKDSGDLPWFQLAKGLAEYRSGRFPEAAQWAGKALEKSGDDYRDRQATSVLAMSQHRLGQTEAARANLARALELGAKMPKIESGDIGEGWLDWIIAHTLLGEAKSLIEAQSK